MKKIVSFTALALLLFIALQAFSPVNQPGSLAEGDVKEVLKNSCFDCHSDGASNKKGKNALNFDAWDEYKTGKKISKLSAICDIVSEGKMPPEKYLKSKPEAALTDQQKKLICEWTSKESASLLEGN